MSKLLHASPPAALRTGAGELDLAGTELTRGGFLATLGFGAGVGAGSTFTSLTGSLTDGVSAPGLGSVFLAKSDLESSVDFTSVVLSEGDLVGDCV